jgi:hypothetical protein
MYSEKSLSFANILKFLIATYGNTARRTEEETGE